MKETGKGQNEQEEDRAMSFIEQHEISASFPFFRKQLLENVSGADCFGTL